MKIKISVKEMIVVFLYSTFFISFFIWSNSLTNENINSYPYEILLFPWVIFSILVTFLCFFLVKKVHFFDFGLWFYTLSICFMFGYIFLKIFNLKTTLLWQPEIYFTRLNLFKSSHYSLSSLTFFSFVYIFFYDSSIKILDINITNNKNKEMIGYSIYIFGLISNLYVFFKVVGATRSVGSYTGFTNATINGMIATFAQLIVPGLFIILNSTQRITSKNKILIFLTLIINVLYMMLSGSRKIQIFTILSIILFYELKKRLLGNKTKINFGILVGGVIFLNLIYVIREYRMNLLQVPDAFFNSLIKMTFFKSIIAESFAETGLTFYSVTSIFTYVPQVFKFESGLTFIKSLPSIFPLGGVFNDIFNSASSTFVINKYSGIPAGSSLIGDLYWNFGYLGGILSIIIFAYITSKFISKIIIKNSEMYFTIFFILIQAVRVGIFELTRPIFLVGLLPFLLIKFSKSRRNIK